MKWHFLFLIPFFLPGNLYAAKHSVVIEIQSSFFPGSHYGVKQGVNAYVADIKYKEKDPKETVKNQWFFEEDVSDSLSRVEFILEEGNYVLILHGDDYAYDKTILEVKPQQENSANTIAVGNDLDIPRIVIKRKIQFIESMIHIPGFTKEWDGHSFFDLDQNDMEQIRGFRDFYNLKLNTNPNILTSPQSTNAEIQWYMKQNSPYKKEIILLRMNLFEGKIQEAKILKEKLEKEYGSLLANDIFFPVYQQYLQSRH